MKILFLKELKTTSECTIMVHDLPFELDEECEYSELNQEVDCKPFQTYCPCL